MKVARVKWYLFTDASHHNMQRVCDHKRINNHVINLTFSLLFFVIHFFLFSKMDNILLYNMYLVKKINTLDQSISLLYKFNSHC